MSVELENNATFFKAWFPDLSAESVQALIRISQTIHLEKDEHFIRFGELKYGIALVAKGTIRGYYYAENGQEMTPFFWHEELVTASWETIFLNQPAALDFQAIEKTTLIVIDYVDLKKEIEFIANLKNVYIRILETIFANTMIHNSEYVNAKPEQRYEIFRKRSPHLINRISEKHIASHLGITPISFSRMKKRLK